MPKKAWIYMLFVILAGIAIFVESLLNGWDHLTNLLQNNIWLIISMLILSAISRSCPLYLRNDQAFDISVISTVALYLCVGTRITIILYVVSTLITFEKCADGTVKSLYNMDLKKTLFNVANIVLSIAIPGLLCHVFGVSQAGLVLPNVLLKAVIFSVGTYLTNALLSMTLFCLMGMASASDAFHQVVGLMPNVLAAMPIGLVIALIYNMNHGVWLVLLMLLPLLLARYAWKLYLDAQKQQMLLIDAIVSAMEAKDKYTEGHSRRVHDYAMQIGQAMGMPRKTLEILGTGALLHDVGKIGIDDSILRKPDRLTDEEWQIMRSHPDIGVRIVSGLGFSPEVLEIIHNHHQRYDGSGYPPGAAGTEIEPAVLVHGGHLEHGHVQALDAVAVIPRQLRIPQGDVIGEALAHGLALDAAHVPGVPAEMLRRIGHIENGGLVGQDTAPDLHVGQLAHPPGQRLIQGIRRADAPAVIHPVAGLDGLDRLVGRCQLLFVHFLVAHVDLPPVIPVCCMMSSVLSYIDCQEYNIPALEKQSIP